MSAPATSPVAWKSGRNFGCWHLVGDDPWVTLCAVAVPQRPLQNVSRIRGRDKSPTCSRCLRELDRLTAKNVRIA